MLGASRPQEGGLKFSGLHKLPADKKLRCRAPFVFRRTVSSIFRQRRSTMAFFLGEFVCVCVCFKKLPFYLQASWCFVLLSGSRFHQRAEKLPGTRNPASQLAPAPGVQEAPWRGWRSRPGTARSSAVGQWSARCPSGCCSRVCRVASRGGGWFRPVGDCQMGHPMQFSVAFVARLLPMRGHGVA